MKESKYEIADGPSVRVKIVKMTPTPVPNNLGGLGIVLYGLGDDGLPYMWQPKEGKWLVVK